MDANQLTKALQQERLLWSQRALAGRDSGWPVPAHERGFSPQAPSRRSL